MLGASLSVFSGGTLSGQLFGFGVTLSDTGSVRAEVDRLLAARAKSQPLNIPSCGSVFKNPPDDFAGRLIEACNLKGRQRGGAEISERHANVIVNNGGATARDVVELMLLAYRAVNTEYDVALEPELILVGELRQRWTEGVG